MRINIKSYADLLYNGIYNPTPTSTVTCFVLSVNTDNI